MNNLLFLTFQDGIYVVECLKVCFLLNCANFIIWNSYHFSLPLKRKSSWTFSLPTIFGGSWALYHLLQPQVYARNLHLPGHCPLIRTPLSDPLPGPLIRSLDWKMVMPFFQLLYCLSKPWNSIYSYHTCEIEGSVKELTKSENSLCGTPLAVQWLRICLTMQEAWVRSLVRELRSHMKQSN